MAGVSQDPRIQAMVAISTIYYGWVVGAEESAAAVAAEEGTEAVVLERVMSEAELEATERRVLLRGGREGTHFVTDGAPDTAAEAQQQLALP